MPGILAGLGEGYQKPAKKSKVPRKGGEPAAKGGGHTQVGELDDEMKEPTPAMKAVEDAHHEKRAATREWVAGRMSSRKHKEVHARANHIIKHPQRYFGKK
jgi:hypothetical protein